MRQPMTRSVLWLLLALPAALMLMRWSGGDMLAMDMLEPTGEMAIRLMVLALLPGPLVQMFGPVRWLNHWLSIRRNLGVAAFLYALLHLAVYVVDMGALRAIVDEFGLPGIWTGWLALALMAPAAAASSDRAMRWLGRRWKQIQRVVYFAFGATLAHWLLIEWSWQKAAIHAAPVLIVWMLRTARRRPDAERKTT